jgi:phosphomannomutase
MSQLIISVSGVRGIVGDGLTTDIVDGFAAAFGAYIGRGSVLVSRDSRPSGSMLASCAGSALVSVGCSVIDGGILPTPTAGFAVRALGLAGGLQVTASHNPAPWNGLKMFGRDGAVLPAGEGEQVRRLFESQSISRAPLAAASATKFDDRPAGLHEARVLEFIDLDRVCARRFRIILDANGGAGGPLGLQLLAALGCQVSPIGCEPDGQFLHEPEPTPAHLPAIAVRARELAIPAFCLDPDADRLALIDETGRCLSEELTLALAVKFRLGQERGPVVVNMSTSRVIADLCRQFGASFQRTPVGEANVVAGMRAAGAIIGGEGNGGVIDPRVGWVRDPYIGMAMILNLMAESGEPLSRLADDLPHYVIVKEKIALPADRLPALLAKLQTHFDDATPDPRDGLRLDWPDRWLHVRGSNTEPIVRVIAETPTEVGARLLIAAIGQLV